MHEIEIYADSWEESHPGWHLGFEAARGGSFNRSDFDRLKGELQRRGSATTVEYREGVAHE